MNKKKPIVVATDSINKMPAGDRRHEALKPLNAATNAALAAVNGRASSFATTTHGEIWAVVEAIEKRLTATGLPRNAWKGITAKHVGPGPSANSYKYPAVATGITLERRSKDWILTDVARTSVYPKEAERLYILISPSQAEEIQKRAIGSFTVQAAAPAATQNH